MMMMMMMSLRVRAKEEAVSLVNSIFVFRNKPKVETFKISICLHIGGRETDKQTDRLCKVFLSTPSVK